MNKLKLLLILSFISLATIPTALGSTAPIVYVATDGSGDYNCDGINDHTEINQALEYVANHPDFTTVYLKSGTYTISDTIFIGSDTTLEGNSDSIVKIVDNARWPLNKAAIAGNDASNVIIQGFEIDGNYANNNEHGTGALYYNLISLSDVHNVKINNMYLHDNANDLIKIEGSSDIYVFNNVARYQGHEFVYTNYVNNLHVYDNSVLVRVNSAIRTYNTNHIKIYGNEIYGDIGGYVGIYIIKAGSGVVNDVEIYDNEIYNTLYSGILLWGYGSYSDLNSASNVHIHHNIIRDCGTSSKGTSQGGISIQYFHNTVIENNVIDNIRGDGIAIREVTIPRDTPSASGFKTIVRNNIITNSYPHPAISGSGYGIRNYLSSTNSVIAENNCVYGNVGTYTGGSITYSNNIETDPLFVDAANHDYRLKSNSPIIGAGIGVYESGDSTPPTPSNTAPVLSSIGDKTVTEGSALSFVVTASDADGDSLTYSASGLPTGATFDAASRTFSWTPGIGQEGTYDVTFEVTDSEFTDSESVSIIVNPDYTPSTPSNTAPVLSSIGDKTVTEGSSLSFVTTASDADGDSLTYSASGLPTGATFDAASRTFSWTPGVDQAGTYDVTFGVSDGELTDSDTVLVTVRDTPSDIGNVNLDIVSGTATIDGDLTDWQYSAGTTISGVSDNTATVKAMYDDTYLYISYDVTDSNLQADGLTETSGLHLDDSVEIYLDTLHNAGAAMQADDYHFIINLNGAVVDNVGTGTGKDYSYTSNILNSVNLQGTKNDASADTGYIVEVAIPWSDIGGQPSSDVSGLFLAVNDQDNTGTVYLLNWCDLTSSYAVPDFWGDATIAATSNTAPVMTPIDDRAVDEGNTVSFTVSASDAEDNLLTYSVSGLPSGASFDATSGVFSWTPSDVPTGEYGLVFEVTDGELTDSEAMIITVNAVNNDPLVNNLPVITAFSPANGAAFELGDVVTIGVSASDADGQELNYLLKIDGHVVSTTSSYAWKPDLGTHAIEAVVSDGTDQVTAQHVITVIKMHPRWDVNKDGVVNILDITIVAQNLGTDKPHPSWDVNGDNEVNIQDLTIVAHYFGETIPQ